MHTVILKPATLDGVPLKIRKPQGGYLAEAGEAVVLTSYWRRRRSDGDVVVVERHPGSASVEAASSSGADASPARPVKTPVGKADRPAQ